VLGQAIGSFCVAHDDELLASFGRSQHVLGTDCPAVSQNNRLSFRKIFAHRTVRHAESRQAVGQKMATHLALERKRKAFGIAMTHMETVDGELAGVEDPPLHQRKKPFEPPFNADVVNRRERRPLNGAAAGKTENAALEAPEGRGARDAAIDCRDADNTEGKHCDLVHGDGSTLGLGRPEDLSHDD
jgi:hypothetical protein